MEYLEEKVEMHDTLNPSIWAKDNHLRPEVKNKLEEIVNEFLIELEENEIPIHILDVHLVGSNASYNYTDKSDLDVHIIANLEDVTCDPYVLNLLYGYFKSYFNDKYDISIHDVDVELYIEDVNTSSISNGIYSLFDDEWVKFPEKIEVPDVDISKDIIPYKNMYDSAMNSKDGMEAIMLVNDLYLLRRNSLSTDGEYGIGNLIFKQFRNNGWLDKLKDLSKMKGSINKLMQKQMVLFIDILDRLYHSRFSVESVLLALNIPRLGDITARKIADANIFKIIVDAYKSGEFYDLGFKLNLVAPIVGNANTDSLYRNAYKLDRITYIYDRINWNTSTIESKGKVAITGKLSVKRDVFEKELKDAGWVLGEISKDTKYLITDNPNSSSSKNKKADQWEITKITEAEFRSNFM